MALDREENMGETAAHYIHQRCGGKGKAIRKQFKHAHVNMPPPRTKSTIDIWNPLVSQKVTNFVQKPFSWSAHHRNACIPGTFGENTFLGPQGFDHGWEINGIMLPVGINNKTFSERVAMIPLFREAPYPREDECRIVRIRSPYRPSLIYS